MRLGWKVAKARWLWVAAVFLWTANNIFGQPTVHDYCVELTASVSENPSTITLQWLPAPDANSFEISRKVLGEANWTKVASVDRQQTSWTDGSAAVGVAYEYQVFKPTSNGYSGYGYICSAIRRNAVEERGKVILLVEQTLAGALPTELARLQQDLVGDGWTVVRRDVAGNTPVPDVRNLIRSLYQQDPAGTKALFLFGHIPVAYSGDISPDNHSDDQGAWPADVYYADVDGQWTDTAVTVTNTYNRNVPGDGKFDQSVAPASIHLQMGRVDLSNLTCFSNKTPPRSEVDLARQYLNKDHNFRHGLFNVQRRAMIFDRMYRGLELEPQTCAAWRSFPAFFGREQINVIGQDQYFPILSANSYLWSYAVSGGSFYGSDYIGTSDSWALNEPKVVFTSFLGSWFGMWDRESDFLRAPLGTSGYTLTCIYSGQPQWILHPMALGEPIGYSAMLTQNNNTNSGLYPPQINAGFGQVHIALMGDPTLRMHTFPPGGVVTGSVNANGVTLSWSPSTDPGVTGYLVYTANSVAGPFTRISGGSPLSTTSFTDPSGNSASFYMVRAVKIEETPSGSYYNLSQGMFYPDSTGGSGVPETPRNVAVSAIIQGGVTLEWISPSASVRAFEIQRRTTPSGDFSKIAEAPGTASSYTDSNLGAGTYAYRIKALGFAGDSDFSSEASINLQPSWSGVVGVDKSTQGNWIGRYGSDGYMVACAATNFPSYVTVGTSNATSYVLSWDTTGQAETLLRPDGKTRLEAYWKNNFHTAMTVNFRFHDSQTHRVAIYMVDSPDAKRSGFVDLMDPFTGRTFSSLYYTNFNAGEYVVLDVRNYVDVRFTSEIDYTGVLLSGIFFSPPAASSSADQVTFVGTDTTTGGSWQSKYGSLGRTIAGLAPALPQEIAFNPSANQSWTWSDSTTDPRAPVKSSADPTRVASVWYSTDECVFELAVNEPRQLSFYFLDWDRVGRVQDVTFTDSSGNTLLQQRIQNFENGQYVTVNAQGHLRMSIRRVAGLNAVLNGMFIDPAQYLPAYAPPAKLDPPKFDVASGGWTLRITGQSGQVFDIQRTSDLRNWLVVGRAALSGTTKDYPLPITATDGWFFYRAVLE